jgi:membrane protease YdiL (CAAX protease family)
MPETPNHWAALHGLAVWIVIAGVAGYTIYRQGARAGSGEKMVERLAVNAQARNLIGLKSMGLPPDALLGRGRDSFHDPVRLAILAGELVGLDKAEELLPDDERAAPLRRLYRGRPIQEAEREKLRQEYGWFGKVALSSQDDALHDEIIAESRRTVVVFFALLVWVGVCVLAGIFLLVLLLVLGVHGHLKPALGEGPSLVYAEMFAAYLLMFLGLGLLANLLAVPRQWALGAGGLAAMFTLSALAWPVLRGVGWQRVRGDLGLYSRRPLADIALGLGTYVSAVPLVLAGVLIMLALSALLRWAGIPQPAPSHPLGGVAEETAPWWVWAQVFFAACIAAPIVEEVFFRGALFTHLRRLTPKTRRWLRFLFAAAASSFLFAVIHPQGFLGVPVLGALAGVFCLAREVNGSLLPSVIAHALHNFVATLVLLLAFA